MAAYPSTTGNFITGSTATSSASNSLFYITTGTGTSSTTIANTTGITISGANIFSGSSGVQISNGLYDHAQIGAGLAMLEHGQTYELPDGSKLEIDDMGNYKIKDKSAKVTYQACKIRAFNRYINASDLLEEFIKDMGKLGAKQNDILNLPLELFINWLICTSAEADGDPYDDVPKLPGKIIRKDRCRCCGWFIPNHLRRQDLLFYAPDHYDKYLQKVLR